MKFRAYFWTIVSVAGLAGGYALAAGQAPTSSADPAAAESAASPPAASISIAKRLVDAAGALERYVGRAKAVSGVFDSADSVSRVVSAGAAYNPDQLEEGAVAYAALIALQQPAFVDALSTFPGDAAARAAYVQRLTASPDLVLQVPGATQAAGMASRALGDMAAGLANQGQTVANAAYTVQRQPWSLDPVDQAPERLARVEAAARSTRSISDRDTQSLMASIVARRAGGAGLVSAHPSPLVLRGLVLAAAAMLGQAGEEQSASLTPLMREPETTICLRRAKLNLHECLSASGAQYEDLFCTGRHALADTGDCLSKAAGDSSSGVSVPVARGGLVRNVAASVTVPVARSVTTIAPPPSAVSDDPPEGGEAAALAARRSSLGAPRPAPAPIQVTPAVQDDGSGAAPVNAPPQEDDDGQ